MDLQNLKLVIRWLWLLAIFPVISGAAGFFYAQNQPVLYEATTTMMIGPGVDSPNPDLDALRTGAQLMQTYAELPSTDSFLQAIITNLSLDLDKGDLSDLIDIRPIVDTQILKIVVQDEDPDRAIAIANEVAAELVRRGPSEDSAFVIERIREQARSIEEDILSTVDRIELLTDQLSIEPDLEKQNLIIQQIADEEQRLSNANTTLANLYEILYQPLTNRVSINDLAEDTNKVQAQLLLTLMISISAGIIISVLIGIALLFYELSFINVNNPTQDLGISVWGTLNVSRADARHPKIVGETQPNTAQQYQRLGVQTLYFRDFKELTSLLVMGIDQTPIASSVAANLATVISQTDNTVVLLDVDLHQNTIGEIFALQQNTSLADILRNNVPEYIDFHTVDEYPCLNILPSGVASPEKAFTLISSPKMTRSLEEAKNLDGILLINAPPLSVQQGSLALGPRVDGVVLVVENRRSRISEIKHTVESLSTVGAQVVGIIITKRGRF
ncbi:MAG: hypothetical protein JXA10_16510 [Anaerolineae bacterium]|nr:hypothetical protein [Anaerolineae bacterium]